MMVGQLVCLALTVLVLVRFTILIGKNIMQNRCHTDNLRIEDLHGHTEPHI